MGLEQKYKLYKDMFLWNDKKIHIKSKTMEQMISIPESLYLRLVDYFDDRSDADGDSQGYHPNEEMRILSELQECSKRFELRGSFNDNTPIIFSSKKDMEHFLKKDKK